jgi:hypothetical protein
MCITLVFAKDTAEQKKAKDHCIQVFEDAVLNCLNKNPYMTTVDCTSMEQLIYQDCLQKAGLARETPPKFNPKSVSTGKPSGVKQASPTPIRPHHLNDLSTTNTITSANANPTPTPSAKPKFSPNRRP